MSSDNVLNKEMQRIQLGLLQELDRVCRANNIKYYMACGTCLGAIRHKGFIPWDHDIDVMMYWKDAQKLLSIKQQFKEKFFLQTKNTDVQFNSICFRLRDSSTSWFKESEKDLDINHGISMDIYILYDYPDNPLIAHKRILESYLYRLLVSNRPPNNHGNIASFMSKLVLALYSKKERDRAIKRLEDRMTIERRSRRVATFYGLDVSLTSAITYERKWFAKPMEMKFENDTFLGPTEPEMYLTKKYGDYMKLPDEEHRVCDINYIYVSTTEPYTQFKGRYY